MTLSEQYRPTTFNDVVGQDKAVRTLGRIAPEFGGRGYWIQGKSGTGKTTLARIIASHVAAPEYTTEIVGRLLTVNQLREMWQSWYYYPLIGEGYALIVNEAHGLSKPVIEYLLDILEGLKSNVVIVFTTTNDGADLFEEHIDAGPFASRCMCVKLTSQGFTPAAAKRLHDIANRENLNGKPLSDYEKLVNRCGQNMRDCLNRIEAGEMLA